MATLCPRSFQKTRQDSQNFHMRRKSPLKPSRRPKFPSNIRTDRLFLGQLQINETDF